MLNIFRFMFCLIAALSGTPLRQAEAASDFARSHAESPREGDIETIDGGVGDDSGATIHKNDGVEQTRAGDQPSAGWHVIAPAVAATDLSNAHWQLRSAPWASTSSTTARRRAWLQCFRF